MSESLFLLLFLLRLEVQWILFLFLLIYCSWRWKLYKSKRSFIYISFSLNLLFLLSGTWGRRGSFVLFGKKLAIFLNYLWKWEYKEGDRRLDLQRIFFLLPNNVFLYRFELLPLVTKLAVLYFFVGFTIAKNSARLRRIVYTPEEHYLRACCWFGYIWETWMTLAVTFCVWSRWRILQLEREKKTFE